MKKLTRVVVGLIVVSAALWLVIFNPGPPPPKSLAFTITPIFTNNAFAQRCLVTISNASEHPVEYTEGFGKVWLDLAFLTNGTWVRRDIATEGGSGPALIQPHAVRKDSISVPEGATELKVGMEFASLTWRGRLAWSLAGSTAADHVLGHLPAKLPSMVGRVANTMLNQDRTKRSQTNWSEVFPLQGKSLP